MQRIERLKKEGQLIVVTDPVNIYYLTHQKMSRGRLLIHSKESVLFVDSRYFDAAKKSAPVEVRLEAQLSSFIAGLNFEEVLLDPDHLSYKLFRAEASHFPGKKIVECDPVKEQRLIKDSDEIAWMTKSAQVNEEGYHFIKERLEVGMRECDVAWAFEQFVRERGADRLAFDSMIAFGEHTAQPHYRSGQRRLEKGDPVLFDLGVVWEGYCSDLSRSFTFGGEEGVYEEVCHFVKQAQTHALALVKPGALIAEIAQSTEAFFHKHKREQGLRHNLGHGVGLDIHEKPLLFKGAGDLALRAGMVITIEPGYYETGRFGARIEDMVLVTEEGFHGFYSSGHRAR